MPYRADQEAARARLRAVETALAEVDATLARHADGASVEALREEQQRLRARVAPLRVSRSDAERALPLLATLHVASPCREGWESMHGDERVRHCARCDHHVYNLSAMTRDAAETLLRDTGGEICVRFYRRQDGTVFTEDRPRGLASRLAKRVSSALAAAASILGAMLAPAEATVPSATVGLAVTFDPPPSSERATMGRPDSDLRERAVEPSTVPLPDVEAPERRPPASTPELHALLHELAHPGAEIARPREARVRASQPLLAHEVAHLDDGR